MTASTPTSGTGFGAESARRLGAVLVAMLAACVLGACSGGSGSTHGSTADGPLPNPPGLSYVPATVAPATSSAGSSSPTATSSAPSSAPSSAIAEPPDVPALPTSATPIPTDAPPPGRPQSPQVVPYTSASVTPTKPAQIVEWQPAGGLSPAESMALSSVATLLSLINQQNFPAAWRYTTGLATGTTPTPQFTSGYATTRFYQVAFGQPRQLAADLIVIPARFVSRQDPAAQGSPSGVGACTYWPQYVFLMAKTGSRWADDVPGRYASRPELAPLLRPATGSRLALNPISQRSDCG